MSALARELQHFGDIRLTPVAAATHQLEPAQAEALRKMLLSVVSDPRLVLARLARQLVELNASKDGHAATRERLALETREVFAPLANRLGLWQLKWELEDLAFRFLQPDDYRRIAVGTRGKACRPRALHHRVVPHARRPAARRRASPRRSTAARNTSTASIARWSASSSRFEQVFDLRAVRIVTATVADCYAALGLVHGHYTYIPGEFDDYIATPKDNFYRSIHTAVLGPGGQGRRSADPHARDARPGGARPGGALALQGSRARARRLLRPQDRVGAQAARCRPARPRRRIATSSTRCARSCSRTASTRSRPRAKWSTCRRGATPLDFAYHVHTDLGHRCRGARVNGRIVPLTRALANGEVVEILTHKLPAPEPRLVVRDRGLPGQPAQPRQGARLVPEVRRGRGEARAAGPAAPVAPPPRAAPRRKAATRKIARSPVVLGGVEDLPISLARCCAPVKPEPIAGYATVGRGVTVHRADCPGLKRMSAGRPDRLIAATWADAVTSAARDAPHCRDRPTGTGPRHRRPASQRKNFHRDDAHHYRSHAVDSYHRPACGD